MYVPKQFEEPKIELIHELIHARPLATLVTLSSAGLNANHIPLHLSAEPLPFGTLRGHVARANPLWADFSKDTEVLAVFHGPDTYITPSWYATKQETGKVVPTWNYVVAHAYGSLRIMDDAKWVRSQLEMLTTQSESAFAEPWNVSDAPPEYIEQLLGAIVGIEIVITKLHGKWKISQNQSAQNRRTVIQGLKESGSEDALLMADLIATASKETK
jgi:transcriptional regulator